MNWILKRFRVVISISLVFSIIIAYLIIYQPMYNELKTAELTAFLAEVRYGERMVNEFLNDCMNSATVLSDRAELKEYIVDYLSGRIDSGGLKSKTQPLYANGAESLRDIKGAIRFVNGIQVSSFGSGDGLTLSNPEVSDTLNMVFDFENYDLIIHSPIFLGGKKLGYDVLRFDMKRIFDVINADRDIFILSAAENSDLAAKNGASVIELNGRRLLDDGRNITYSQRIDGTDVSFTAKVSKAVLHEPVISISVNNLITAVIWYIILLVLTNWIIIRFVRFKLNQTEKSKELYREYAYRDTLTGAFSRLYFDLWSKSRIEKYGFINEDICVVMIDINRYKFINDTYGHAAGDRALARVSKILQMSVKEEDLVVRYGGDEFLLVLLNCKYDEACKILSKISGSMQNIEDINFGISISYGIEHISSYNDLKSAVQRADKKMYEFKNAYNALLNY